MARRKRVIRKRMLICLRFEIKDTIREALDLVNFYPWVVNKTILNMLCCLVEKVILPTEILLTMFQCCGKDGRDKVLELIIDNPLLITIDFIIRINDQAFMNHLVATQGHHIQQMLLLQPHQPQQQPQQPRLVLQPYKCRPNPPIPKRRCI